MSNREEQRYLELRQKFATEAHEIQDQMRKLEARYEHLASLLNGDVTLADEAEDEPMIENDNVMLDARDRVFRFIKSYPGSSRQEILENMQDLNTQELKRALESLRKRSLIKSTGSGRGSTWTVV